MNTLYSRLKEICQDHGIENPRGTDIQRIAGISSGRVSQIKQEGESARLGEEALTKIIGLGYNPSWVQDGKGPKTLLLSSSSKVSHKGAQSNSNTEPAPDIKGRVPLISFVQAGMWTEHLDIYEPGYAERWLPHLKNNGENTFALRVSGDSMTAKFGKSYPEGCIVFVDPDQRNPSNGDRIVAKLNGSKETTFKVFTQDAGRCWLRPLNDSHPPIFEEFTVIGKVIGKWEDE